jgi:metal-responsive CopG/Arc/MetJ family transcriptional regulator
LVADPCIENDAKIVRINLSMDSGIAKEIDAAASARKLTRSACLAQAARHEIERWAPPHNTADDFASALWLWYGAFPKT